MFFCMFHLYMSCWVPEAYNLILTHLKMSVCGSGVHGWDKLQIEKSGFPGGDG